MSGSATTAAQDCRKSGEAFYPIGHATDFMMEDAMRALLDAYPAPEHKVPPELWERWKAATKAVAEDWCRAGGHIEK